VEAGNEVVRFDKLNEYYDLNLKLARLEQAGFDRDAVTYNNMTTSKTYPNYRFIKLELEDRKNLEELFKTEKFDVVVNLAAQAGVRYSVTNRHFYVDSNGVGFTNLLEIVGIIILTILFMQAAQVYMA
jgi:UDP-glucuronate 4-epimerase